MAQDPLNVLWIEPHFPGRLGAAADWLARRRGYRCWFYCHTADVRQSWPRSVGRGLEVQFFGVGGVAQEPAVAWSRTLERSLCYAYGCWEVLEVKRPRPIDLIVGRSAGLGSSLFAPVYWPAAPVVNFFDYYVHPSGQDLADEDGPQAPPTYLHWRRSANAADLLELEQCGLAWTPTQWQRHLFPPEYRDDLWVQYDGVDTSHRRDPLALELQRNGRRTIAGRSIPEGTKLVSFVARSLDRLRGLDRFWEMAGALLRARRDVICVIVGDRVVRRGLDIAFHDQDFTAHLIANQPPVDPERLWFLGTLEPTAVADVLSSSDLHVAPGRTFPVSRSLLEAMAAGCVLIASDTAPHREVITSGENGILSDAEDVQDLVRKALAVLDDPAGHRSLGRAAAERVRGHYSQDVCLPRLADRFQALALGKG